MSSLTDLVEVLRGLQENLLTCQPHPTPGASAGVGHIDYVIRYLSDHKASMTSKADNIPADIAHAYQVLPYMIHDDAVFTMTCYEIFAYITDSKQSNGDATSVTKANMSGVLRYIRAKECWPMNTALEEVFRESIEDKLIDLKVFTALIRLYLCTNIMLAWATDTIFGLMNKTLDSSSSDQASERSTDDNSTALDEEAKALRKRLRRYQVRSLKKAFERMAVVLHTKYDLRKSSDSVREGWASDSSLYDILPVRTGISTDDDEHEWTQCIESVLNDMNDSDIVCIDDICTSLVNRRFRES